MTTTIEVRTLPAQRLLVKKITCSHQEIGPSFGKAIQHVSQCLRASGASMASPPMAVYLAWRSADCDMAVGCQVTGDVTLSQECEWLDLAGGPHAFASHLGPYSSMPETHHALIGWCQANGKNSHGIVFESYPVDPGSEPDPQKWRTDIFYPIG